jgi:hypothetical protein
MTLQSNAELRLSNIYTSPSQLFFWPLFPVFHFAPTNTCLHTIPPSFWSSSQSTSVMTIIECLIYCSFTTHSVKITPRPHFRFPDNPAPTWWANPLYGPIILAGTGYPFYSPCMTCMDCSDTCFHRSPHGKNVWRSRTVTQSTCHYQWQNLRPKLRMTGAMPLLLPHAFMACTGTTILPPLTAADRSQLPFYPVHTRGFRDAQISQKWTASKILTARMVTSSSSILRTHKY